MKAPRANKDPFTQAVINLRSHMVRCYDCKYVMHEVDVETYCRKGMMLAAQVAKTADGLLKAKRKAVSTINGHVYACPDISVHGEAYAMTAEPLAVVAAQDGLF